MNQNWKKPIAWAGGCTAALVVVYVFPPSENHFYPRCPFYALTHWLCPGCGGTRAMHELLHLHLGAALRYNALVTVLAPLVLPWLAWCCYQAVRYGEYPRVRWPRTIAVCLGIVSLAYAVARNTGAAIGI